MGLRASDPAGHHGWGGRWMRCGRRPGFRGDSPISGPTGAGPVSGGVHSTGAAVSPPTGCGPQPPPECRAVSAGRGTPAACSWRRAYPPPQSPAPPPVVAEGRLFQRKSKSALALASASLHLVAGLEQQRRGQQAGRHAIPAIVGTESETTLARVSSVNRHNPRRTLILPTSLLPTIPLVWYDGP